MTIPRPPSPLTDPQFVVLSRGTTLHRVHRTTFRAAQFNSGLGEPTRFAQFTDGSGEPVPSLYASATLQAAIHETILHDVPANARIKTVRVDDVYIRTHSELETNRELRLVESCAVRPDGYLSRSRPSRHSERRRSRLDLQPMRSRQRVCFLRRPRFRKRLHSKTFAQRHDRQVIRKECQGRGPAKGSHSDDTLDEAFSNCRIVACLRNQNPNRLPWPNPPRDGAVNAAS